MRAARIKAFGSSDEITIEEVERPVPAEKEICIDVQAAGVGPWDALVRQGFSALPQPLPLILGSDVAGVVVEIGARVSDFAIGDEVFGVTNSQFTGGYAEYANVSTTMVAKKPSSLSFEEAASVPVVVVTAFQMLFDYAQAESGQRVLIHGGAGNVGAFAVQLGKNAGLHVTATASEKDMDFVRSLGADIVIAYEGQRFEDHVANVDAVLDTVGGDVRRRSYGVLRSGGRLVTAAAPIPDDEKVPRGISAEFFLVEVTRERLQALTGLFESGVIRAQVGTVLPLDSVITAHEMLGGAPHPRGKIVLDVRTRSVSEVAD